jgi:MFS family permease
MTMNDDERWWFEQRIRDLEQDLAREKGEHRMTMLTALLGPILAAIALALAEPPHGWAWLWLVPGAAIVGWGFMVLGYGAAWLVMKALEWRDEWRQDRELRKWRKAQGLPKQRPVSSPLSLHRARHEGDD